MSKKILVVDDSPTSLQFIKDALLPQNYKLETADDVWVANIIGQFVPDLILLDVMINGLKIGNVVVSDIRKCRGAENAKIYFHSSLPESELQDLTAESGADGYICKKESAEELLREVQKAL